MKSVLQNLAVLAVALISGALLLEAVLRLAPGIITLADLANFPSAGLRAELAAERGLPTGASVLRLERPDGGPAVELPAGPILRPVDPVDLEYGAVETEFRSGGFCNRRPPAEIRPQLVAVGDSFTYCTNVAPEQSWVPLLGARLDATALNLGMPGQGLYEYHDALRTLVDTTRLDTVVVAIYEGNDLRDGLQYLRHSEAAAERGGDAAEAGPEDEGLLLRHSYFLNTLIAKFEVLEGSLGWVSGNENFHYTVRTPDGPVAMNVTNSDQNEIRYARRYASGELGEDRIARVFEEPMGRIAAWARGEGAALLFVYIPSAHTAYGELTTFADPDVGTLVQGLAGHLRQLIAGICDRQGYDCLDMTPVLNERVTDSPLAYFPGNVHLTPQGNQLVAEEIARHLDGR